MVIDSLEKIKVVNGHLTWLDCLVRKLIIAHKTLYISLAERCQHRKNNAVHKVFWVGFVDLAAIWAVSGGSGERA